MLTAKNEGVERVLVPAGAHVARCYGVIDLGTQYSEKFGAWSHKVLLQWELPSDLMQDGRPLAISKTYSLSLNEKAILRKDLESWLGRGITTKEEHEGFALGSMLGASCLLSVVHSENNGKVYANVGSVMSVPKGMTIPDAFNPMVSYDIENGEDTVFEKLPDWVKTKIRASREFQGEEEAGEEEAGEEPSGPITEEQKMQINNMFVAQKLTLAEFSQNSLAPMGVKKSGDLTSDQAQQVIALMQGEVLT